MNKVLGTTILALIAVGLVAFAAEAPLPVEMTPPEAQLDEIALAQVENACVENETPGAVDLTNLDAALTAVAKPPCKPCKDKPSCTCSYNGKPRISCNPCCWQGPFDPFPICSE